MGASALHGALQRFVCVVELHNWEDMEPKWYMLRARRYHLIRWSLLPERIDISVNASGHTRWIRIGLLPGMGAFKGGVTMLGCFSIILVKPPEARTYYVEKLPLLKSKEGASNRGDFIL